MLITLRMLLLCVHFVLASLLGLLLCICRPFNPDNTRLCAKLYALPALKILGVRTVLDMQSLHGVPRPAVIVANHLSNYDLFVFGQVVPPRTVSLGKKSLKWLPLFGQIYWLAGNVLLDRGNAASAKRAMTTITQTLQERDMSIWVFAEGTRSHGRGLGPLKKGAFQMAINAGVPVVPVCASQYIRHWNLNRWHSGTIALKALPPLSTTGLTLDDMPELMDRCHAQMKACIDQLDQAASPPQPAHA
ncbi:1-acylglycerol-3-phosphate O-acyltransferase [Aquabacterium sp. A3]|uniref:lysophospholipid acyltransferase family protein n=1 Tax=Aquabacterium sp. A3 TaxID=3132829 RepID=UPI0031199AB0